MKRAKAPQSKPKGLPRFRTRVLASQRPSGSLVLLRLERPPDYAFEPGQFLYVFLDGEKRAYSIASPPTDADGLDLCVKKVEGGPASNLLYNLEPGAPLEVSQPLGAFRFATPHGVPVVFLATGTGVAPLRAMIRHRLDLHDARPIWLFLGSSHLENLPYHDEFQRWTRQHANFHYVPVLSKGPLDWPGERGWIQEPLLKHFHRRRDYEAYVCGVKRMVEDVREVLLSDGLHPDRVHRERYD